MPHTHDFPAIKFGNYNYSGPTYSFEYINYFTPEINFLEAIDDFIVGLENYLNDLKLHSDSYKFRQRNAGLTIGQVLKPNGPEQR